MKNPEVFFSISGGKNENWGIFFRVDENLSRGVLPENLRRGLYAVVDERCKDTTLDPSMKDLQQRHFLLLFGPLY